MFWLTCVESGRKAPITIAKVDVDIYDILFNKQLDMEDLHEELLYFSDDEEEEAGQQDEEDEFEYRVNCTGLECQYCLMLIEKSEDLVSSNILNMLKLLRMGEKDYKEKEEEVKNLHGQYLHYDCFVT